MKPEPCEIGVGATPELSLRVSVGVLVSVLFHHPEDGRTMLALERTATLRQIEGQASVIVKAKPFGGAVQLIDPQALKEQIGHFHYDSERSREEADFRIQIRPAQWEVIKEICRKHSEGTQQGILDSGAQRELAEEFEDALHLKMTADQYQLKSRGIVVEDLPGETENVRASGQPTVRVYFLFEAWVQAAEIILQILANSRQCSDAQLQDLAWKDARQGGRGRANGVLALPLEDLRNLYRSFTTGKKSAHITFAGHRLDGNVLAILDNQNSFSANEV